MDSEITPGHIVGHRLSRRSLLRQGLMLGLGAAALPILAACGNSQPAASSKPAATATSGTSAAASPTTAAASKPATGASPAAAAASPGASGSPAASGSRPTPPAPTFNKVPINGKLSVIIDADF